MRCSGRVYPNGEHATIHSAYLSPSSGNTSRLGWFRLRAESNGSRVSSDEAGRASRLRFAATDFA